MGATEEQMELVEASNMDHVSYILILYSLAFIVFLFANMLIHIYDRHSDSDGSASSSNSRVRPSRDRQAEEANLRAAEEFELDGLSSDDEDDRLLKPINGETSPSTVGRNNEPIAR